jgi:hypothetical protein
MSQRRFARLQPVHARVERLALLLDLTIGVCDPFPGLGAIATRLYYATVAPALQAHEDGSK